MPRRNKTATLVILLLLTCPAMTNWQNAIDCDLFWHMRAGREILAAGWPDLPDSWTFSCAGRPWVNQQWLAEIVFYGAYSIAGFWGLILVKDLVAVGIALGVAFALRGKEGISRWATALAVVAYLSYFLLFRTYIFTFLFMVLIVVFYERVPAKRRLLGLLPLFALWANIHAFFLLGLFVLGCYTGVACLGRWLAGGWSSVVPGRNGHDELAWEAAALPLSALASLVNPFGFKVWVTAFKAASQSETNIISEWWPIWKYPMWQVPGYYALLGTILALCIMFPKAIRWRSMIPFVVLSVFAFLHIRFVPIVVLPAIPLLGSLFAAMEAAIPKTTRQRLAALAPLVLACLVAFVVFSWAHVMAYPYAIPARVNKADYPVLAVEWMQRKGLSGRVFNEFGWGGYVEWSAPEFKVVIDGRTATLLYPLGFVRDWDNTVNLEQGWRSWMERGIPDYVLLRVDWPLTARLASDPSWILMYRDHCAALYGRKQTERTGSRR